MLGRKIKLLREAKGLMQKDIAFELQVDITYVSRMENNEKPVSRNYLKKLSHLLEIPEKELQTLWLADKLYEIARNEPGAMEALNLIQLELKKTNN